MSTRPALALALAIALVPTAAAARSPAPDGVVRLGLEGGATWFSALPTEGLGPAGLVRARVQVSPRLMLGAAFVHVRQFHDEGLEITNTFVPVTLDLRLDRAPVAPFLGAGVAAMRVTGGGTLLTAGPVLQGGVELRITDALTGNVQGTYATFVDGGNQLVDFPFFSAWTAGIAFSVL